MLRITAFASAAISAAVLLCCTGDDPDLEDKDIPDATATTTPDGTSSDDSGSAADAPNGDAGPPDAEGKLLWTTQIAPGIASGSSSVAVDSAGNVFAVIPFDGTNVAFGSSQLTSTDDDIALVKLSPAGSILWAKKIGGMKRETPAAISVDAAGAVYVAGSFNSAQIDVSGVTGSAGASPTTHGFIAKLTGDTGNGVWVNTFKMAIIDAANYSGECTAVRARAKGVAFACTFFGSISYDGAPGSESRDDRYSSLVGVIDPMTGSVTKSQVLSSGIPSTGNIAAEGLFVRAVELDTDGNLYAAGQSNATAINTRATQITGSAKRGNACGFVVKLIAPDLAAASWIRMFGPDTGTMGNSPVKGLRIDDARSALYATGTFSEKSNFGKGEIGADAGSDDLFALRMDYTGTTLWTKAMGGPGLDNAASIDVDPWGRPLFAGYLQNSTNAVIEGKSIPNGNVLLVAKLDPDDGATLYLTARGTPSQLSLQDLASGPNGNAVMTGTLGGTIELDRAVDSTDGGSRLLIGIGP